MTRKSTVTIPSVDLSSGVSDDEPELFPDDAPLASSDPPTNTIRYVSRIRIVDAWQYLGALAEAPAFVDRNWAAWGDADPRRELPAGPALRVPTPGALAEKLARAGDYIVRQSVTLVEGLPPEEQIDVWPREDFERFFLPQRTPA
jgi:hypothetical protein